MWTLEKETTWEKASKEHPKPKKIEVKQPKPEELPRPKVASVQIPFAPMTRDVQLNKLFPIGLNALVAEEAKGNAIEVYNAIVGSAVIKLRTEGDFRYSGLHIVPPGGYTPSLVIDTENQFVLIFERNY